jgi:AraC-like DNA-binding protein
VAARAAGRRHGNSTLAAAASRERFFATPAGRYLRGRCWLFGCLREGLFATFLAGRPDEDDLEALGRAYVVPAARQPHVILFDGSRLSALDTAALGRLLDFLVSTRRVRRHVLKVAVVHGNDATGAVIAGYPQVIGLTCETKKFTATGPALAWLGAGEKLGDATVALADTITADDADLVRLRAMIAERLDATIDDAARALGLARRSLQRRLREAGTTWQREIDRARLAAAEKLLCGDERLTRVALEVGFASLQSFSDWFRVQAGMPPTQWRRQRR